MADVGLFGVGAVRVVGANRGLGGALGSGCPVGSGFRGSGWRLVIRVWVLVWFLPWLGLGLGWGKAPGSGGVLVWVVLFESNVGHRGALFSGGLGLKRGNAGFRSLWVSGRFGLVLVVCWALRVRRAAACGAAVLLSPIQEGGRWFRAVFGGWCCAVPGGCFWSLGVVC